MNRIILLTLMIPLLSSVGFAAWQYTLNRGTAKHHQMPLPP